MKSLIRSALAGLAFGIAALCGLAFAQTITSSIQLSQDGRGPFGVDSNIGVYFPGHLLTPSGRPPPVLTACVAGTGGSFAGTDFAGTFTQGNTGSTSCVVTFGTAFLTAPNCTVTWNTGPLAAMSWTTSTTALTITQTSATTSKISYICTSAS